MYFFDNNVVKLSKKLKPSSRGEIEIIDLENKYKFLKSKKSPSTSIGYKPSKSFEKYKHKVQMLSLSNAFDYEDLKNFEKKILNFLKKALFVCSPIHPLHNAKN